MSDQINIHDIYEHNINFIIGSGASYGLFPTLALKIKDSDDIPYTIETLATQIEQLNSSHAEKLKTLLFMHYYESCIKPIIEFDLSSADQNCEVIQNYEEFIQTILEVLIKRRSPNRRCNLFTTNYDGCFAFITDKILSSGAIDFVINDGARGFRQRSLQARNFNSYVCCTGIFERHHTDIPQINLIHLHGSAYWVKQGETILVDYRNSNESYQISSINNLDKFSALLDQGSSTFSDLENFVENSTSELTNTIIDSFWGKYNQLPVVNPTKWKFHETVFEEHYYQMLRAMSYELEKPNTVFISFGFSFADEHILNLVKRSLSNPQLRLFICCFNESEKMAMQEKFRGYNNVQYVTHDSDLDFTVFNKKIFTLQAKQVESEAEG